MQLQIPSSITEINNWTFRNNKLKTVKLHNKLEIIGSGAFEENEITDINIPSSVKKLGAACLIKNKLPDSKAFIYERNSDGSENKAILNSYGGARKKDIVIPNTVSIIYGYAFYECGISSITIPNSVITIHDHVFNYNSLKNITIPQSVSEIYNNAFINNPLEFINMPGRENNNLGTNWFTGTPSFTFN